MRITDVAGVESVKRHCSRREHRTGVTAVLHIPAISIARKCLARSSWHGFGQADGSTQVDEMGDISNAYPADVHHKRGARSRTRLIGYMLALPAMRMCCPSTQWSAKPMTDT